MERLVSAQAPNQHSQHMTDWVHIFPHPWLHSASVPPTPTLIPGIRPNFPLFLVWQDIRNVSPANAETQRGSEGQTVRSTDKWPLTSQNPKSGITRERYVRPRPRDEQKACGVVSAELTAATTSSVWTRGGTVPGSAGSPVLQAFQSHVEASSLCPPITLATSKIFSANCTNASLLLTSFSHQWGGAQPGRAGTPQPVLDVT